jgi:hypothetical protein
MTTTSGSSHSLSPEDVGALARAAGLAPSDEDAREIAHRLNAFLAALAPLADLPLEEGAAP